MTVGIHVGLNWLYELARLVLPIIFCGGLPIVQLWQESPDTRMFLIAAVLGPLAIGLAWWMLPIRCITDGCPGRMRRTAERISFWQVRATYCCEDCGAVRVEHILSPNIEITSGDY